MIHQLNYAILGQCIAIPTRVGESHTVYELLRAISQQTDGRIKPLACEFWLVSDT